MEQKPNSLIDQGSLLCCKFAKKNNLLYNVDLVNDDVFTKFCLILSIRSQDIE